MNSKEIEILEGFINNEFQKDKLEMDEKGGLKMGTIYKVTELSPSIETLLKRYKELKEENETWEKIYKELKEENKELEKKYKIEQLKNVLDEKCLEEALKEMEKDLLKEIEEPINVLINFAVCCSPSLNCDEYCTYNDEDCTCGKLNEDFELRESVLKLRKYFKMKGVNEDEKEN